jgi:stage II sporulation protein E
MATKETTKGKRPSMRLREREQGKTGIMKLAEAGICLLLGAILSSAQIFGRCTPFGVAAVAAAGSGISGFCTLIGTVAGYLLFQGVDGGLQYSAASVLTYAVAFAFYDFPLGRKQWFLPAVAALLCGISRFIQLSGGGWFGADVIFFFTELFLLAAAAYFYRGAFETPVNWKDSLEQLTSQQRMGLLTLGATGLIALAGVQVMGEFSIGRIVAAIVVMTIARKGQNAGLLGGVTVGMILDLASGRGPYYTMAFAVAGLMSGLCWNRGKLASALAYVAANAAAVLWTWDSGIRIGLLYEVFAASVLFFMLPQRVHETTGQMLAVRKPRNVEWERAKDMAARHMHATARAFRDLYESIREVFHQENTSVEDVTIIFRQTAERQCRRCSAREACWQKEYNTTQQVLNDAVGSMIERGRAVANDFSSHFRSRCIHFPEFLAVVNEELMGFLYRRQYQSRMRESRAALCRQYAELDRILGKAATELSAELTPDLPREAKLKQFLRSKGLDEDGTVFYDEKGHLRVELPEYPQLRTEEGRERLSSLLGIPLRAAEESEQGRLIFCQAEPFMATAGVSGKNKEGETVSGDTGTWFRREDGLLCILLCDGMGSGAEARKESGLAVRLLQNFLKAGVDPEAALCTVNSALALKGEETGGCTTVDLLTIELFTGLCSVYKFGAAPTYLRKSNKVSCITGSALPAGIMTGDDVKPDVTRFRAGEGDWILLLSDGMIGGESDGWLRESLGEYEGHSPGELANKLLDLSIKENESADDSTVIAVRVEKRT